MKKISKYNIVKMIHSNELVLFITEDSNSHESILLRTTSNRKPSLNEKKLLKHEHSLLTKLNPTIMPTIIEYQDSEARPFITFKDNNYVILSDYIKTCQDDSVKKLKIAIQIAEIISEIHSKNLLGFNIDPSAFLIDKISEHVVIYNTSKLIELDQFEKLNEHIESEKTLPFLSPEETGKTNQKIDYKINYYHLGAILYNLFTNQYPFESDDTISLTHKILTKKPTPAVQVNSNIEEMISNIILKLLEKNTSKRYQSSIGVINDLKYCLKSLIETGKIKTTALAQHDVKTQFHIKNKLYGRKDDIDNITQQYNNIKSIKKNVLFVSGYSGVGKSSLVGTIQDRAIKDHIFYAYGKFDIYLKNTPLQPIQKSFNDQIDLILTRMSKKEIDNWRNDFIEYAGNNVQLLLDFIPNFKNLMGETKFEQIKTDPSETKNRFIYVICQFIEMFSKHDNPLIIFLDDLQCASSPALALIDTILENGDIKYFYLLGAYRSNEVEPGSPLSNLEEKISSNKNINFNKIELDNLEKDNITNLITDSFPTTQNNLNDLSEICFEKTHGNPYFLRQFLYTLYQKKLLYFSYISSEWQWNIELIKEENITDNVIELTTERISTLDSDAQTYMKIGSCIGNVFSEQIISHVKSENNKTIYDILVPAINSMLLLYNQEKSEYRFAHDKVRESVYLTLETKEKENFHYEIGKYYYDNLDISKSESDVINTVIQFNNALSLISNDDEKLKLAELNLLASITSQDITAFNQGLEYAQVACRLLSITSWGKSYELLYNAHLQLAQMFSLTNKYDESEKEYKLILKKVKYANDKIKTATRFINLYCITNDYHSATQIGVDILNEFYGKVKLNMKKLKTIILLLSTNMKVSLKKTSDLVNAPKMKKEEIILINQMLQSLLAPSFFVNKNLSLYFAILQINYAMKYGNTDSTAAGYTWFSIANIGAGAIGIAKKIIDINMQLLEKYPNPNIKSGSLTIIGMLVTHQYGHVKNAIPVLNDGYNYSIESGSYNDACICIHQIAVCKFAASENLTHIIKHINSHIPIVKKIIDKDELFCISMLNQLFNHLTSKSLPNDFFLGEINTEQVAEVLQNPSNIKSTFIVPITLCIYYLHTDEIANSVNEAEKLEVLYEQRFATSIFYWVFFFFFSALAYIKIYKISSRDEQKSIMKIIKKKIKILDKNHLSDPINLYSKVYILKAEYCRLHNKNKLAVNFYNEAIKHAKKYGFTYDCAIANTLLSEFYLMQDQETIARAYLLEAIELYNSWGATALSNQLIKKHSEILDFDIAKDSMLQNKPQQSKQYNIAKFIDIETVFKASQTIANAKNLKYLIQDISRFITENCAADNSLLVLERNNKLYIHDYKLSSESNKPESTISEYSTYTEVPHTLVDFVTRTKQPKVVNNIKKSIEFSHDPYFKLNKARSCMAYPLQYHGNLIGLIYLENNQIANAFSQEQLGILEMLTGQISDSIVMVNTYEAYEKFVPKKFIQILNKSRITDVALGDAIQLDVVVLFCDIRNFTSISEILEPNKLFTLLNTYLDSVVPIITNHGGFIDKYIGDGILAIFPPSKTDQVLQASIEIQNWLSQKHLAEYLPRNVNLKSGIGINIGSAVLGVLGTANRMDTTVISDAVNTTARLDNLNKYYDTSILITDTVIDALDEPQKYQIYQVGAVFLKGKLEPTYIYEVIDWMSVAQKSNRQKLYKGINEIKPYFDDGNFSKAIIELEKLENELGKTTIVDRFIEHCKLLEKTGTPDNWKGIMPLQEK